MQPTATRPVQVFLMAPAMLCWGLERLIQSGLPRMELAGTAVSVDQVLATPAALAADVLVIDLDTDEPETLAELQSRATAKLVLLTALQDAPALDRAVVAGVRGVVRKSDPPAQLLRAIEKVHGGELWVDRAAPGRIFMEMARQNATSSNDPERLRIASLTPRERQMIAAFASDVAVPGKVIASRLCISEHTLRNHLSSIYGKLGLANRLDLYAYATRHRLDRAA